MRGWDAGREGLGTSLRLQGKVGNQAGNEVGRETHQVLQFLPSQF